MGTEVATVIVGERRYLSPDGRSTAIAEVEERYGMAGVFVAVEILDQLVRDAGYTVLGDADGLPLGLA